MRFMSGRKQRKADKTDVISSVVDNLPKSDRKHLVDVVGKRKNFSPKKKKSSVIPTISTAEYTGKNRQGFWIGSKTAVLQ